MVKAHYQNDLNEYKRFGIFHTLRARWWYIAMLSGLFLVCGAGLLALGILRGDAGIVSCAAICFVSPKKLTISAVSSFRGTAFSALCGAARTTRPRSPRPRLFCDDQKPAPCRYTSKNSYLFHTLSKSAHNRKFLRRNTMAKENENNEINKTSFLSVVMVSNLLSTRS